MPPRRDRPGRARHTTRPAHAACSCADTPGPPGGPGCVPAAPRPQSPMGPAYGPSRRRSSARTAGRRRPLSRHLLPVATCRRPSLPRACARTRRPVRPRRCRPRRKRLRAPDPVWSAGPGRAPRAPGRRRAYRTRVRTPATRRRRQSYDECVSNARKRRRPCSCRRRRSRTALRCAPPGRRPRVVAGPPRERVTRARGAQAGRAHAAAGPERYNRCRAVPPARTAAGRGW